MYPDNPKQRNVRIEIGEEARSYVTGQQIAVQRFGIELQRTHSDSLRRYCSRINAAEAASRSRAPPAWASVVV
jgi:hypothetical protein